MRIARYCTSVLISGRTIPVDVTLLRPLRSSLVHVEPCISSTRSFTRTGANSDQVNQGCRETIFLILVFLCYSINCLLARLTNNSAMAVETGGCEDDEKNEVHGVPNMYAFVCIYRVYCKFVFASLHPTKGGRERERERERDRSFASSSLNVRILYGYDVHRIRICLSCLWCVYVCCVRARAHARAFFTCKCDNVCVYPCACVCIGVCRSVWMRVCYDRVCSTSGRSQIFHIYIIQLACSIKIIYNCYNI